MIDIKKELVNLMSGYAINYEQQNKKLGFNLDYLNKASIIFGVSVDKILSKNRARRIVWIRYILYNYLKSTGSMTLTEVGKVFNRDHATVIHGLKKHSDFLVWNDLEFIEMDDYFKERI